MLTIKTGTLTMVRLNAIIKRRMNQSIDKHSSKLMNANSTIQLSIVEYEE